MEPPLGLLITEISSPDTRFCIEFLLGDPKRDYTSGASLPRKF